MEMLRLFWADYLEDFGSKAPNSWTLTINWEGATHKTKMAKNYENWHLPTSIYTGLLNLTQAATSSRDVLGWSWNSLEKTWILQCMHRVWSAYLSQLAIDLRMLCMGVLHEMLICLKHSPTHKVGTEWHVKDCIMTCMPHGIFVQDS